MPKPDATLLLSQLLDLHLSRAIAREKLKDQVMRKFVQLAEDVEADLKELDNDADELNSRRLMVKEAARQVVNDHHRIQDRVEDGIAAMRRVAESAGLPNSRPRTAAELAAMKAENEKIDAETAAKQAIEDAKIKAEIEKEPEVPSLGEGSGDTPSDATFQPKPE